MKITFKKINELAVIPKRGTQGSAGFDLTSVVYVNIPPSTQAIVRTGLVVEFPAEYAGMVCPRSGLAAEHNVTVANAPGIIDSDYRGELMVILANHNPSLSFSVVPGDRIAQMLFVKIAEDFEIVDGTDQELSTSERGTGGLGSTGVSTGL